MFYLNILVFFWSLKFCLWLSFFRIFFYSSFQIISHALKTRKIFWNTANVNYFLRLNSVIFEALCLWFDYYGLQDSQTSPYFGSSTVVLDDITTNSIVLCWSVISFRCFSAGSKLCNFHEMNKQSKSSNNIMKWVKELKTFIQCFVLTSMCSVSELGSIHMMRNR